LIAQQFICAGLFGFVDYVG